MVGAGAKELGFRTGTTTKLNYWSPPENPTINFQEKHVSFQRGVYTHEHPIWTIGWMNLFESTRGTFSFWCVVRGRKGVVYNHRYLGVMYPAGCWRWPDLQQPECCRSESFWLESRFPVIPKVYECRVLVGTSPLEVAKLTYLLVEKTHEIYKFHKETGPFFFFPGWKCQTRFDPFCIHPFLDRDFHAFGTVWTVWATRSFRGRGKRDIQTGESARGGTDNFAQGVGNLLISKCTSLQRSTTYFFPTSYFFFKIYRIVTAIAVTWDLTESLRVKYTVCLDLGGFLQHQIKLCFFPRRSFIILPKFFVFQQVWISSHFFPRILLPPLQIHVPRCCGYYSDIHLFKDSKCLVASKYTPLDKN